MASVHVALLTPFDGDQIDTGALSRHIEFLVDAGVDGLITAGTTGEGALLEGEEVVELVRVAVESTHGRAQVIAHIGLPSTRGTILLAQRAVAAGADAVMAVTPYYVACGDEDLVRHYDTLVRSVPGTPALAYTIPSRVLTDIKPSLIPQLQSVGVAGLKDSTKDFARHREYLRAAGGSFAIYMGSDGYALDALEQGASGLMSALANVRPDLFLRLREAVAARDPAAADSANTEIIALREAIGQRDKFARLKALVADATRSPYPIATRAPAS